ncbi:MAG: restriction endonuclease subunit S [Abditibacteriota bacterium]|nr:restriction endonuclease subunit S [Abditibacteriota bacterium]
MNKEINNRINVTNNLRINYLRDIVNISVGGDVPKDNYSKNRNEKYQIPIYSNGIREMALYGWTDQIKINEPCITISARGTIGYCTYRNEPFYPIVRLICITKKDKKIDLKFLFYYLDNMNFIHTISGIPQLTIPMINKIKILVPPREEQEKIANILGECDRLIALKKERIEEEKKLKKYLMQKLLNPNSGLRLPGFTTSWKKDLLQNLCSIDTGKKDVKNKQDNGLYPLFIRSENIERINTYSYDGEAILIPGDGKVGDVFHYYIGKFDYHQRVYKLSDFNNCLGKYIYYYLQTHFKKRALALTAKATVDSLRMEMLTKMQILIPSLDEQESIVNILSSQDNKIELLEKELEEWKTKKKSLMQLLLTGIVRV